MTVEVKGRIVQVTNISPTSTMEQMRTLFGHIGVIEDIVLYPPEKDDTQTKLTDEIQFLTRTTPIWSERPLIPPLESSHDLLTGLSMLSVWLSEDLANRPYTQLNRDLRQWDQVDAYQHFTCEGDIKPTWSLPSFHESALHLSKVLEFFNAHAEVKCVRMAGTDEDRAAYVEFTEQPSVVKAFGLMGATIGDRQIMVQHSNCAIIKPASALLGLEDTAKKTSPPPNPVLKEVGRFVDRRRSRSRSKSRDRSRRSRSYRSSRRSRSRSPRRSRNHQDTIPGHRVVTDDAIVQDHGLAGVPEDQGHHRTDVRGTAEVAHVHEGNVESGMLAAAVILVTGIELAAAAIDSERSKEKGPEPAREKERERSRDKDLERSRDRESERSRDKDGERSREKDHDRPRERERGRSRERDRSRMRDKERERDRDSSRGRRRDRSRDRDRERERDKTKGRTDKSSRNHRSRSRSKLRSEDVSKAKKAQDTPPSPSRSENENGEKQSDETNSISERGEDSVVAQEPEQNETETVNGLSEEKPEVNEEEEETKPSAVPVVGVKLAGPEDMDVIPSPVKTLQSASPGDNMDSGESDSSEVALKAES
ncbi:hypothetical protein AAHC03_010020 [Spirometra sp. Aus1]